MKLWMVVCDFIADHDYGINCGLIGTYDSFDAAKKAKEETVRFLIAAYNDPDDPDDYKDYVSINEIELNHTYSGLINIKSYPWGDAYKAHPDICLASYVSRYLQVPFESNSF